MDLFKQLKAINTETRAIITMSTPFKLNKKSNDGTINPYKELVKTSRFRAIIGQSYSTCHLADTGRVYIPPEEFAGAQYAYINKALCTKGNVYYIKCQYISPLDKSTVMDKEGNIITEESYAPFLPKRTDNGISSSYRVIKLSNIIAINMD